MLALPEIVVIPKPSRVGRFDLFVGGQLKGDATYLDLRVAVKTAVKDRRRDLWDWFREIPEATFAEGAHRFDWAGPKLQPIDQE